MRNEFMNKSDAFDPDLPTVSDVLASLCCVITQYTKNPSAQLARLALDLSRKLGTEAYSESTLITAVGQRLQEEWSRKLMQETASPLLSTTAVH